MVMLAILQCGEDANGYQIRLTLERIADRTVTKGAFYTTLDRLEEKGYLTWELRVPTEGRSDLPQRHFVVTTRSRTALLRLWNGFEGALGG